jgi:PAS domain S-box-containing protein
LYIAPSMEKRSVSTKNNQDEKFLNALAEAFRLQEAILNTTGLAIISATQEGIITSFNRAAENLLGYNAEEVIGKSSPLIFHDLDEVIKCSQELSQELGTTIEPVFDLFTIKARKKNTTYTNEWTLVRKDGSRFPATVSIAALRDDQDTITGYVSIPTDITALKEIDERAQASEQKFKILAENIPGTIYLCHNDASYTMIYLNDHIEKITGYPAHDFLSGKRSITELYHPEEAAMIYKSVDEALKEKRKFQLRYRLKHTSGEWRWIDEVGVGVYAGEKLIMLEGFLTDITTQKEAEEKLQRVAEENLRVFNSAVTLNAIAGFDGYFKRISLPWTTLLGWTEEELKARPFIEFVHPDDVEPTLKAVQFISEGNNLFTFENRYRCKDGSYRWLLWGSAYDLKDQVIYASAIDITERKKSEEQLINSKKNLEVIAVKLQEQNRQLDEFAHIISHNLRSPVGNIQALIKLLNENSSMEEYKLIFDKLKNVAKNLSGTMNDLMDTLKVKARADVERTEVRFKEILDKVVQSLEGELIVAEAAVTFDFNKASSIFYPKPYLESIFQNLLSNALKYRSPKRKTEIHVESDRQGNSIVLRVTDNGQGIDLEKFGDKLFGLHRTFHTHEEARGVGLFLIKTQIESMGGSINVESTVDKSTVFIIRFN